MPIDPTIGSGTETSSTDASGRRSAALAAPRFRAGTAAILTSIFAATAALRFLTLKNGFPNDHFVYISGGRQMLLGEWPTRDWIDPGFPLMFTASALAQGLFGQTQFAEAILVAAAFALAAVFTALTVRALTRSWGWAAVAVVLEVAIFPRTYGYPKVLVYAAAFWLFGRYVSRPTAARAAAIAAAVTVGFLFRHDHGVYLLPGAILTLVLAPGSRSWRDSLRRVAVFAAFLFAFTLPYLIYVEVYAGLWSYLRIGVEFSQREAERQWHVWPAVFGDTRPLESALVYEFHALPFIALALVAAGRRRSDVRDMVARIVPLAVAGVVVNFGFIRDPLTTRLADAIVPAAVLAPWLLSRAWHAPRLRIVSIPVALLLFAPLAASIVAVGGTMEQLDRTGLLGRVVDAPGRFGERASDLRARFTSYQIPSRATAALVPFFAYVDRCTTEEHRLLMGGFDPEIPFYARRLFAAGQAYFASYFSSTDNQLMALGRMRRQVVPLFILSSDYAEEFEQRFPIVAAYVHARYMLLTEVTVEKDRYVRIFVDSGLRSAGLDPETGWPCFSTESARSTRR
jgi:hypothetical protein